MPTEDKTLTAKLAEIESFFKEAFDAEEVKVYPPTVIKSLEVIAVVEMKTKDRGVIYLAALKRKAQNKDD